MPRTAPLALAQVEALGLSPRARRTAAQALAAWPGCGRVVLVDGAPVGLVVYPLEDRRGRPVPTGTADLTLVWVAPEHAGVGLGRMLVQAMAADLRRRGGFHAVDASPPWTTGRPPAPRGFLTAVGFRPVNAARPARVRLDLRATLPDHAGWREEAEAALERLRGVVRPVVPSEATLTRVGAAPGRPPHATRPPG